MFFVAFLYKMWNYCLKTPPFFFFLNIERLCYYLFSSQKEYWPENFDENLSCTGLEPFSQWKQLPGKELLTGICVTWTQQNKYQSLNDLLIRSI